MTSNGSNGNSLDDDGVFPEAVAMPNPAPSVHFTDEPGLSTHSTDKTASSTSSTEPGPSTPSTDKPGSSTPSTGKPGPSVPTATDNPAEVRTGDDNKHVNEAVKTISQLGNASAPTSDKADRVATVDPAQPVPSMEKPVEFLSCDDDNKFFVSEDAKAFLENVTANISVVAVAGRYRTGKSYLLNRLFNTNKGFGLGSTVQSKTKGIWMWAKPHPRDPDMLLILLDTEGLHDVEKGDQAHDVKLFSLAILLSKCLVYNSIGSLDERAIRELELVSSLTEHIKISEKGEENGSHFGKYFPHLFVVLRDFFLDIHIDGRLLTSDEYLEHALKLKTGRGRSITDYNTPRECIRDFFPKRNCFKLCKPVDNDEQLKNIDELDETDLKEQFVSASKECVEAILDKATQFEINQDKITGQLYLQLAQIYVEAINDDTKVPCVESTIDYMRKSECKKAVEKAMAEFNQVMLNGIPSYPVDLDTLQEAQAEAFKAATESFENNSMLDSDGEFRKQLVVNLENIYDDCKTQNTQSSKDKCQELLKSVFGNIKKNVDDGLYQTEGGYEAYCQDKTEAISAYKNAPGKGPEADNVLNDYIEDQRGMENTIRNADKALDEKAKELKRIEEEKKLNEERARASEEEKKQLEQELLRQANDQKAMMEKVQKDLQEQQHKHEQEMKEERQAKEKEYQRLISEGMTRQAEQQQLLLEQMAKERERADKDSKEKMQLVQKIMEPYGAIIEDLRSQRNRTINQVEELRAEMRQRNRPAEETDKYESFLKEMQRQRMEMQRAEEARLQEEREARKEKEREMEALRKEKEREVEALRKEKEQETETLRKQANENNKTGVLKKLKNFFW